jgi:hypothetical protein
VTLTSPVGGEIWSGTRSITWTTTDQNPSVVDIEVSTNSGGAWTALATALSDTGTYSWDTTSTSAGMLNRIRVTATDLASLGSTASASGSDFVLQHYGWTRAVGGGQTDGGTSVAADLSGNVYATGTFAGAVNFRADWGGTDSITAMSGADVYLTKVNADGSYGWTRRFGGTATSMDVHAVTTDSSGNVFITGNFDRQVNFAADWGGNVTKAPAAPLVIDAFVVKVNADGSFGWVHRIGGAASEFGYGVATDGSGNVFVSGAFQGTVDFQADWGGGTDLKTAPQVSPSIPVSSIFLTKINANGTYGWTRTMGDIGTDRPRDVCTDGSGNIYVCGEFSSNPLDFRADWGVPTDIKTHTGSNEGFVTRVNADGSYGWTFAIGGAGSDSIWGVVADGMGNIYVTGDFPQTVDFRDDWGAPADSKTPIGNRDAFVTKINANSTYGWTRQFGGTSVVVSYDIACDGSDNIYIVGAFVQTVDFRADWGGGTDIKSYVGGSDAYFTRINADGTYGWTRQIGGGVNETGNGIAVDGSANVYVIGEFNTTVDFRADWGTATDSKTSLGFSDMYLTKSQ